MHAVCIYMSYDTAGTRSMTYHNPRSIHNPDSALNRYFFDPVLVNISLLVLEELRCSWSCTTTRYLELCIQYIIPKDASACEIFGTSERPWHHCWMFVACLEVLNNYYSISHQKIHLLARYLARVRDHGTSERPWHHCWIWQQNQRFGHKKCSGQ